MTISVRLCLSYDRFKLAFIVFKVDIISIENATLSRTLHVRAKMLRNVWSYNFYEMMLSAE